MKGIVLGASDLEAILPSENSAWRYSITVKAATPHPCPTARGEREIFLAFPNLKIGKYKVQIDTTRTEGFYWNLGDSATFEIIARTDSINGRIKRTEHTIQANAPIADILGRIKSTEQSERFDFPLSIDSPSYQEYFPIDKEEAN